MEEWKECKFKDLYRIPSKNGLSKPSRVRGSGYKMINMGELFSNDRIYNIPMELVPLTDTEKKNAKVEVNDLLFARQSLIVEGAGKCSIVMETDELTVFESHIIRVRLNQELAYPPFFYYYFKNKNSPIRAIIQHCVQAGIKASDLAEITVKLPPLPTQQKIAAILSSLDDKIELNNKINTNLEQQAQALFKNWFVDFEPFGGKMPDEWKVGKLSEIAEITMGQSPDGKSYNEDGIGTVFYQGRAEFGTRFPTRRLFTTEPKRIAKKFDTLMSVRAPVGDTNIANEDCCIGRGLAAIHSKDRHQSFVHYTVVFLRPQLDVFNGEGTVFGCINRDALNNMKVIIPTKNDLDKFEQIVSKLDTEIFNRSEENHNLSNLRDTLLPKLMNGEIEV